MRQNSTLDQVSLCTPGRLNDVAPRPVPPALGADSPDPEAPLSLFSSLLSHPSLIFILHGMPFAFYGLLACSTAMAPSIPPQFCNTVSPHRITSLACAPGDSCIKLSVFLQLAAVSVFHPVVQPGL